MDMKRIIAAALCAASIGLAGFATAEEIKYFRIGTGGAGGTYYPVGGLVAFAISNPPGARPCELGGSCGVPGLVGIAQSSNGSVANIEDIMSGSVESGFAQSDVAFWAYNGRGIYENTGRAEKLRAISNLYPESIHLVARKGAGIKTVFDLRGKRVSLDEPGSGTLVDARIVLEAYGLSEKDLKPEYIKPSPAANKIKANQLDAFFIVAGYPAGAIKELAENGGAVLIPITEPESRQIIQDYEFFTTGVIPAGTYQDIPETVTLSVGAQWVTSMDIDEQTIYEIVKATWNKTARKLLDEGHAKGQVIRLETALDGIAIPLHPGAERFYKEIGLLN